MSSRVTLERRENGIRKERGPGLALQHSRLLRASCSVSFHSGWTFHRAGGNNSDTMREVFTIIYTERDTVLAEPKNKNQIKDWDTWCPGVKVGEVVNSPLNPILYESGR